MMPSREVTPDSVVVAELESMDLAAPDCDLINTLPEGCLTNIFSRVDLDSLPLRHTDSTLHHTIQCALVCKHWASLVDDAVTRLHFAYKILEDWDRELFSIHPSLGPSLKRFPFLRSLRFDNFYPRDLPSVLSALHSGACPLLETLEYRPPRIGHARGYFCHLDELPELDCAVFSAALHHCPLLRELILHVERVVHCNALNSVLRELPNLESFDVRQYDSTIRGFRVGEHDVLYRVHEGLTQLRSLALGHQAQTIHLAPSVDSFPLLERLDLSGSFCVDPPSFLGNLGNLRSLRLCGLALESIPPAIGRLHRLTRLEINLCDSLFSLPESLGNLSSSLLCLRIYGCRSLRSLPESFGCLSSLVKLEISELDSLPESVGALGALREMILDCERMAQLPEALGSLRSLTGLFLHGSFPCEKGPQKLPESLGLLTSLRCLEVNLPSLRQLPASVGQLGGLTLLEIAGRELPLPETLGDLRALKCLTLRSCSPLPESFGCLSSLVKLEISELDSLPESVGALRGLTLLEIAAKWGRELPLPETLGNLRALKFLKLRSCSPLPESLGQLEALEMLTLVHCRLSHLPKSIGKLRRLQELKLLHLEELPVLPECLLSMPSLRSVVITTVQTAAEGHPSLAILDRLKRQGIYLN